MQPLNRGEDYRVLTALTANPIVVVDEIEKAGTPVFSRGHAFGLTAGLLPLLKPLTSKSWIRPENVESTSSVRPGR